MLFKQCYIAIKSRFRSLTILHHVGDELSIDLGGEGVLLKVDVVKSVF